MRKILRCWVVVLILALLVVQLPATAQAAGQNPVPTASKAVVQICTHNTRTGAVGTGTGFGIGKVGEDTNVFVTNWHVVTLSGQGATDVYLMLDNANPFDPDTMIPCEVLYTTQGFPDLAIIRTKSPVTGYKALPLISSEAVPIGTEVYALGYPGMVDDWNSGSNSGVADITATRGIISRRMILGEAERVAGRDAAKVIVHDALIEHGNSGGPLITSEGAVVGINTYLLPDMDGQSVNNYYCSIYSDYAMAALDELGIEYEVYGEEQPEETEAPTTTPTETEAPTAATGETGASETAPSGETEAPATTVPAATGPEDTKDSGGLVKILVIAGIVLLAVGAIVALLLLSKGGKAPGITGTSGAYQEKTIPVPKKGLTIGRDSSCNVVFPANTPGVSRMHCRIERSGKDLVLTDLGSSYGTYVNGTKIAPNTPTALSSGTGFYVGAPENGFRVD